MRSPRRNETRRRVKDLLLVQSGTTASFVSMALALALAFCLLAGAAVFTFGENRDLGWARLVGGVVMFTPFVLLIVWVVGLFLFDSDH